jgi:hypothetical protein
MQKLSSKYTIVYKGIGFAICLVLAAVASEVLFLESIGLVFTFLLSMLLVVAAFAVQIVSFKLCHVSLDRETLEVKGSGELGYVSVGTIRSIKELRCLGLKIAVVGFNEKTAFGKVVAFVPNRTAVHDVETAGVGALKERAGK